jgi:hypothetical protein
LSVPGPADGNYWHGGNLASTEGQIRHNLAKFANVHYYKGWIPERFHEVADGCFCFVHIDVDLYQPTRDAVEFFYPRLSPGGIVVCDDYGFATCPGARKAVDDFATGKGVPVLDLPTGQGLLIKPRP